MGDQRDRAGVRRLAAAGPRSNGIRQDTGLSDNGVDRPLHDHVRDALAHLHDVPYLQVHPLARWVANDGPPRARGAPAAGRRLQACLVETVEALDPARSGRTSPGSAADARVARRYQVIALRYVEGLPVATVQRRLAISRTECFRAQQQGLAAVVSLFRERWGASPEAAGSAPPAPAEGGVGGGVGSGGARAATEPRPGGRSWLPVLPVPLTGFVGRERLLTAVRHRLLGQAAGPTGAPTAPARLLTLTGPPGVGKTRLALRLAGELAADVDHPFHRVVFVPLAPLRDPGLVPGAIGTALGLCESGAPLPPRVQEAVGGQACLLVLDNFEHLSGARTIVVGLLAACPGLALLVTSRTPLRLTGEQLLPVPPLALPPAGWEPDPAPPAPAADDGRSPERDRLASYEAVALFTARVRAVVPDFAVTSENEAVVTAICRRLDGLPLAIELAAARSRVLPPPALLAALEDRLGLLTTGAHDAPPRQRTLRDAIAWSHDLLTPAEQILFRRLAVFADGWTLEDAVAVADPGDGAGTGADAPGSGRPGILETLASLLDHSLIERDPPAAPAAPAAPDAGSRYRMLETLRQYALEHLERSDDAGAVRRRHATHFLALAERAGPALRGPAGESWLARLEDEHANLRAALDWTARSGERGWGLRLGAALWRFWWLRGHLTEGRARLRRLLDRTDGGEGVASRRRTATPADAEAHANVLYGAGMLAKHQGDLRAARRLYRRALAHWRAAADAEGIGYVLLTLGHAAYQDGDPAEAALLAAEGLTALRAAGHRAGIAWANVHLGAARLAQGDAGSASALLEEGLRRARACGERVATAYALRYLALSACDRGDVAAAVARLREAIAISRGLGDREHLALLLEAAAELCVGRAQPDRALHLVGAALAVRREIGTPRAAADRARVRRWSGRAVAALGDRGRAAGAAGRALSLDQAIACAVATGARGADPSPLLPA